MGELGLPHLIIILIVVLVLFGAKRVPEVARSLGSAVNEFKKGMAGDGETPAPVAKAGRGTRPAKRPRRR